MPRQPKARRVAVSAAAFAAFIGSASMDDAQAALESADRALADSMGVCIHDTAAREEAEAEEDDEGDSVALEGTDGEPRLSELERYCPEVYAGLSASRLAPFLEPDWANRISAAKLERLLSLLESAPTTASRGLDVTTLPAVVERVRTAEAAKELSLWQRFKDWLRELFEAQVAPEDATWLDDWLREHWPGDRVINAIAFTLLAILVGTLLWIIYAELRAAGVFGGRSAPRPPDASPGTNAVPRRRRAIAEADDAELPGLLVERVLEQLRRLGQVQDRASMTHRELGRVARFATSTDAEAFRELLQVSEGLRYAATTPAGASIRAAVAGARALLDGLSRQARSAA